MGMNCVSKDQNIAGLLAQCESGEKYSGAHKPQQPHTTPSLTAGKNMQPVRLCWRIQKSKLFILYNTETGYLELRATKLIIQTSETKMPSIKTFTSQWW